MFLFFKKDPLKEQRETAAALLRQARKVWNYRRDAFSPAETVRFETARARLASLLDGEPPAPAPSVKFSEDTSEAREDALVAAFDAANNELHAVLCALGGKIYPQRTLVEWVELVVIATFIACTLRSFFLQPFKIPTNSMYPTYHGMTAEVWPLDSDGPSGIAHAWRTFRLMATRVEARTNVAGEVLVPLDANFAPQKLDETLDDGWFGTGFRKGPVDQFCLNVGTGTEVRLRVPVEFVIQGALLKTYFPTEAVLPVDDNKRWSAVIHKALRNGDIIEADGRRFLRTRKNVAAGGRVANFDVITGDLVLVDRVSYNFTRPSAGDPFVFATRDIPGIGADFYYIKRLVGEPGDTLRVQSPVLLRNNAPITGKPAFDKNNTRRTDLEYYGYYSNAGDLSLHAKPLRSDVKIPDAMYFAMGDNSGNSADSRAWGFVPEKAIVGRAFLILYPFDRHWGLAE